MSSWVGEQAPESPPDPQGTEAATCVIPEATQTYPQVLHNTRSGISLCIVQHPRDCRRIPARLYIMSAMRICPTPDDDNTIMCETLG